jgi:hypothetical protein
MKHPPINPIPANLEIKPDDMQNRMKEWEIVIQTQMHFNDLILRFRTILLTVFATIAGALVTLSRVAPTALKTGDYNALGYLLLAFWILAYFIDIFYYHRMLLGAVAQAAKFDDAEPFKKSGYFGMTRSISNHTSINSSFIVSFFYIAPVAVFLIIRHCIDA